jgi:hypothetical protein
VGIGLDKSMSEWIRKLNAYDFYTYYNTDDINQLLLEGDSKILKLNIYAKEYVVGKRLSQLPYFIALATLVFIGYIYFPDGLL